MFEERIAAMNQRTEEAMAANAVQFDKRTYNVFASDFRSAAISGFCRSFRRSSLSSAELSVAAG